MGGLYRLVAYGAQDVYFSESETNINFINSNTEPSNFTNGKKINNINITIFENDMKYDVCPICLERFMSKDELYITVCNHGFHNKCIMNYILQLNKCIFNCPMCRTQNNI